MTRAMMLCIFASALIGLIVGAAVGRNEGIYLSRSFDEMRPIFLSEATARFAAKQFKYADSAHGREAVLLQIRVLQLLERSHQDSGNEEQLGSAYVRLSMIEEAAGQKAAERAALDQARAYFKRLDPTPESTDDQMKSAVRQMDELLDRAGL